IRFRLHFDRGINVADDDMIRIAPPVVANRLDRTALHQAAASLFVGNDDNPRGIQNFGGFRHEPHAAERDDVAFGFARLAGEFEAVAHEVGEFLNLGFLVMVREQDSPALMFEVENFFSDSAGCKHTESYRFRASAYTIAW